MTPNQRDALVAAFRRKVYRSAQFVDDATVVSKRLAPGLVLFPHQAEWQLATEGWTLLDQEPVAGQHYTIVAIPDPEDISGKTVRHERRRVVPRLHGAAHVAADLAAYKSGKSFSLGAWASGYGAVPCKVELIGLQYDTSEPEFNYLCEFLCSERGMNMKPAVLQNDKRAGRMRLLLRTGASFEVKSWERKETLKGKKIDAYIFCEAYQLPGLECYTSISQNLRERKGHAVFGTTPDRPWVGTFHEYGHGRNSDWHCTCCVDAEVNPVTFDRAARDRDDPEKNGIMTKERYAIAWQGKLGNFVGRVYNYQRGERIFTPRNFPMLWKDDVLKSTEENVKAEAAYKREEVDRALAL